MEQLLLRPEEVAARLACGRSAVYTWMADGSLESLKLGRSRRVPADAVERFVERLRQEQRDAEGVPMT